MATLKIGSYNCPEPVEIAVKLADLDSSQTGRNQSGYMFRDRIRGGATAARTVAVTMPPLTNAQMSALLTALGPASFKVKYPDPYTGATREGTFYVGDRTAPVHSISGGTPLWGGFSFELIEF